MSMDIPNLGSNTFYLACHALLLIIQVFFGIRYKTWGFLFGMFCGHVLEIIGYAARIQMHYGNDQYLAYIVTLTIGPAFFSAAIYLCLARIISVYGQSLSRFSPRTYTITFMIADFLALIFQATGGAVLGRKDPKLSDLGLGIIKTGLGAHLAAMGIFVIMASEFGFRTYRSQEQWDPKFSELQRARKFISFLIGLTIATLCIFIRTAFRVAELSEGFYSKLAENEVAFIVLEGVMVVIGSTCLAVWHPGVAFQGRWAEADFQLRKDGKNGGKSTPNHIQLSEMS